MSRYRIVTLIDITKSNARRGDSDKVKQGQQANFNTLLQTINLRANISWDQDPVKDEGTLPDPFEGRAAFWIWEFITEREDLFLEDDDPVSLLKKDLNGVPVVSGLEETIDLTPAIFDLGKTNQNTFVQII
jgi:hypothetical protein